MTAKFKIGDKITVLDYHTTAPPPYAKLYYIVDIIDDYYIVRPRSFTDSTADRIPFSYPHIKLG